MEFTYIAFGFFLGFVVGLWVARLEIGLWGKRLRHGR
jgi:hypothetical protein